MRQASAKSLQRFWEPSRRGANFVISGWERDGWLAGWLGGCVVWVTSTAEAAVAEDGQEVVSKGGAARAFRVLKVEAKVTLF